MGVAIGQTLKGLLVHLTTIGAFPALFANARALGAEAVTGTSRMRAIHFLAELALVPSHAVALAVGAVAVAVAVGDLALVVAQGTLFALPAWVAVALAVDVFAPLAAEDGADAFAAVLAAETGIALAMAQEAFAFATATVGTVVGHVLGDDGHERHFLVVAVVVVQRQEPVAGFHVVRDFFLDRGLLGETKV